MGGSKLKGAVLLTVIPFFSQFFSQLPSLKLTWPLKMDGWKTSFLLGWPIFRGHVSFGEGTCHYNRHKTGIFKIAGQKRKGALSKLLSKTLYKEWIRLEPPGIQVCIQKITKDPSMINKDQCIPKLQKVHPPSLVFHEKNVFHALGIDPTMTGGKHSIQQ